MKASVVADLLADLLGLPASDSPMVSPANSANAANRKHPCGLTVDSGSANSPRSSANSSRPTLEPASDSQTFAGIRKPRTLPTSKQWRGSSQDSQDSQGARGPKRSQLSPDSSRDPQARLMAPTSATVRIRTACQHVGQRATCMEPTAVGLPTQVEGFAIVSPAAGYGSACAAFAGKPPIEALEHPHRLTSDQADDAHAGAWDDAAIARFQARSAAIQRRGFGVQDAEDLSEWLHLRDVRGEDRTLCLECTYLSGRPCAWRCGNAQSARVSQELAGVLVTMPQRCPGIRGDSRLPRDVGRMHVEVIRISAPKNSFEKTIADAH